MANNAKKREPLHLSLIEAQCNEEARIVLKGRNPRSGEDQEIVLRVELDHLDMLYNAIQEASEILEGEDECGN